MLAENAKRWTREWEKRGFEKGLQEGFEKGRQEGFQEVLQVIRDILLSQMTDRFGPVPTRLRRKLQGIKEAEELTKLGNRLLVASSLQDLDL